MEFNLKKNIFLLKTHLGPPILRHFVFLSKSGDQKLYQDAAEIKEKNGEYLEQFLQILNKSEWKKNEIDNILNSVTDFKLENLLEDTMACYFELYCRHKKEYADEPERHKTKKITMNVFVTLVLSRVKNEFMQKLFVFGRHLKMNELLIMINEREKIIQNCIEKGIDDMMMSSVSSAFSIEYCDKKEELSLKDVLRECVNEIYELATISKQILREFELKNSKDELFQKKFCDLLAPQPAPAVIVVSKPPNDRKEGEV